MFKSMINLILSCELDSLLLDSELFSEFYSLSKRFVPIALLEKNLYVFVVNNHNICNKYNTIQREISSDFFNEKVILVSNYQKWKKECYFNKETPTRAIVDFILIEALLQNISDIHFNITNINEFIVKFKKNTVLYDFCRLSKEQFDSILLCFKVLSSLDTSNKQKPQSSSFEKIFKGEIFDFRFSTHPTLMGERFVIRILSKKNIFNYKSMNFDENTINVLETIINAPSGLVLFVGPTNSGKTTLIHSILSEIAKQNISIMTLEDPVEYRVPNIVQTNISEGGLSFLDGMKSILRQDPDVVFLGEIRDEATAKIAVQAALTGHKVLTTLHAYSNKGAITRLNDMKISNILLSECVLSVLSQRLMMKADQSGMVNIVDACLFTEDIKDKIRLNDYSCLVDKLRTVALSYLENEIITNKELIRVFGI